MSSDAISSSEHYDQYTSFAAELDLVALGAALGVQGRQPCRAIYIDAEGAGTKLLGVTRPNGTTKDLVVATGETLTIKAIKIRTTTTVSSVKVFW